MQEREDVEPSLLHYYTGGKEDGSGRGNEFL